METPPVPKYLSTRRMWMSKFTLRCVGVALCVTVISLVGTLERIPVSSSMSFVLISPPAFLSMVWNIAEGICILKRDGHRGIHPGANVALDLIIWLALLALTILFGLIGPVYVPENWLEYPDYDDYREGRITEAVLRRAQEIQRHSIAIVVFATFLIILHFATFVIACRETNLRNRMAGQTILVMYNPKNGETTLGPLAPVPGGQVYYQVIPARDGLPQQQIYYVPVQPAGNQAGAVLTAAPPVYAGEGNPAAEKMERLV